MGLHRKVRFLAIAGLLVYSVLRFIFVQAVFESYGVNPWIFLAIDCVTAVIYVYGIEYLILSMKAKERSWPRLLLWSFATIIAFAAPYVYIYQSSQQLPVALVIGLAVIITLLVINAIISFKKRLRDKRTK